MAFASRNTFTMYGHIDLNPHTTPRKPTRTNCKNCGAGLTNNKCVYCGTRY